MGIIVMSVAILPFLGIGGMQLFVAEVPGPSPDKLHPRIKETAQKLGISLPTLHDWTKRGIIPAYRINTRVRYLKEDIEASFNKIQSIKYRGDD